MDIYKQIQNELSSRQYENDYEVDDGYYLSQDNFNSAICPICQKFVLNYMDSGHNYIHCSNCNFKINAYKCNGDRLTLEGLADLLNNAVREHNCAEMPLFQLICDDDDNVMNDNTVLMMSCDKCNFMKIIF
jgi:hypothetical protein